MVYDSNRGDGLYHKPVNYWLDCYRFSAVTVAAGLGVIFPVSIYALLLLPYNVASEAFCHLGLGSKHSATECAIELPKQPGWLGRRHHFVISDAVWLAGNSWETPQICVHRLALICDDKQGECQDRFLIPWRPVRHCVAAYIAAKALRPFCRFD